MTGSSASGWGARIVALAVLAVVVSIVWRTGDEARQADRRPIFIEPGEYRGPSDQTLDPAQVEAITQRVQRQNY